MKKQIYGAAIQFWKIRSGRPVNQDCTYLSFLKCVVDKSKNEMPNNKNVIAEAVSLSIKFIIAAIKKHMEASKKHINLMFSFPIIFFTPLTFLE